MESLLIFHLKLLRWKTTIYHELTQMLNKREKLIEIKFRVFCVRLKIESPASEKEMAK